MPAPPYIPYVKCPDGSTAIGDNCGTNVPLYEQQRIYEQTVKAKTEEPKIDDKPQPETILGNGLSNGQKITWVIGLTLAAWGLLYWSQKQGK